MAGRGPKPRAPARSPSSRSERSAPLAVRRHRTRLRTPGGLAQKPPVFACTTRNPRWAVSVGAGAQLASRAVLDFVKHTSVILGTQVCLDGCSANGFVRNYHAVGCSLCADARWSEHESERTCFAVGVHRAQRGVRRWLYVPGCTAS